MLETIIKLILRGSLTAGIAAAAVMLIRLPLKKAPKRWSYLLWAVVFFRCLCPLSVESAVSIFNAVPERAETQQVSDDYEYVPPVDYDPIYVDYSGNADFNKPSVSEKPVRKNPGSVYTILFIVWVSGAATMLLYAVISYVGLMVKMKTAIITEDGIYETDRVSTAFSAGLFPPKIFLPEGLTEKERELIVAHERVHIRRLDFLAKPLAFAGLALHWFNPMVWISFALMTKDMELSCDEAVLKILGAEEKKSYSQALLKVSMKRSGLTALPIAFAGSGIKERVKNVLSYKKSGIIATVIAAVVVLTAGVMLGTDAVKNVSEEEEVFSETLIEGSVTAVTGSSGDMIFIQRWDDDADVGFKHLAVYGDDHSLTFEGEGFNDIDIDNIDPDKIEKAVIRDLRIDYYDDYYGDGTNEAFAYIAVDMVLHMTEDNDKAPVAEYSSSYMESNSVVTKMCGGNEKQYDMYFEMEVHKHGGSFSGYGIQLTGFGETEFYVRDNNLKIADFPQPELMENAVKSLPAGTEVSLIPEDSFEMLFKKFMNEEDITVEFLSDTDIRIIFDRDLEELEHFLVFDILDFMESNFYPDYELKFWIQTPSDDIIRVDENERQKLEAEREERSRREIEERKLVEKESAVQQAEEQKGVSVITTAARPSEPDVVLRYPIDDPLNTVIAEIDSYGNKDNLYFNKGINFPVPEGTPVYAAADGKIINDEDKGNGYGICIIIVHNDELSTLYAHLSEALVQDGDEVKAGDLIGYSGSTGNVYGATLHFEVRVNGQHTDPMDFLPKID